MALGALLEGLGLMGFELRGLGLAGLVAASALTRAGAILAVTSSSTLLVQLAPAERRTQAIAGYWALVQVSRNALGPPATEWLMDALGFRHAAAISGALALAGVALAAASRPAPTQPLNPAADAAARHGGSDLGALAHFSVVYLLLSVSFVAQDAFLTSHAALRGVAVASPFFIAYAAVMIAARLLLGRLPDRYGRAKVMHASLFALVAFFSALLVVRSAPLLWATGALAGAGNALLWPALFAISYERVRIKAYATAWSMLLTAASSALGGLALGAVAERRGHGAIYVVAIGLCLAAWALLLVPRRTSPAAAPPA
jgi:MFS family permease